MQLFVMMKVHSRADHWPYIMINLRGPLSVIPKQWPRGTVYQYGGDIAFSFPSIWRSHVEPHRQEKARKESSRAYKCSTFPGQKGGRGNKDGTNAPKLRALLRITRSFFFVSIVP
jgi:hypothetical protein